MREAIVVGFATSTVKHNSLAAQKMLIVLPLLANGTHPDGEPLLAVDALGAGVSDRVAITSDGKATRRLLQDETTPVRWHVMGIID